MVCWHLRVFGRAAFLLLLTYWALFATSFCSLRGSPLPHPANILSVNVFVFPGGRAHTAGRALASAWRQTGGERRAQCLSCLTPSSWTARRLPA